MNKRPVIATRQLDLAGSDKVTVALLEPVGDVGEYRCAYSISGLSRDEEGRAIGQDGVQALQLAMNSIGVVLYTSDEWKEGRLTWNGGKDLGFPLPDSLKDLATTT
jgi:uncharacterized protein DUF6968